MYNNSDKYSRFPFMNGTASNIQTDAEALREHIAEFHPEELQEFNQDQRLYDLGEDNS